MMLKWRVDHMTKAVNQGEQWFDEPLQYYDCMALNSGNISSAFFYSFFF